MRYLAAHTRMGYPKSGRNHARPARRLGSRPHVSTRTARCQIEGSTMDAKTDAKNENRHHHRRQQELGVPDLRRHDRPGGDRHRQALRRERHVHLRPRLHLDGKLRVQDHLHRRRRGRPALSRLSDRATGRARRLPGDLLPAALRRTADADAEGRLRLSRHAPHDGARADEPVLPGLPARRASDGGDDRLRSARCRRSITTPPTSPIRTSA